MYKQFLLVHCPGQQSQKIWLCHASPNPSDENLHPSTMEEAGEKWEPTMDSPSGSPAGFSSIPGTEDPILGIAEESLMESRIRCIQP